VKERLLPNLADVIWDWRVNSHGSKESPESFFESLVTELNTYRSEFENDATAVEQIDKGFAQIKEFITDLDSEGTERERDDDFYGRGSRSITPSRERSVFHDVDE